MKKKKDKPWYKKKHTFHMWVAKPFMKRFLKKKEGFIPREQPLPNGPALILCNHVTTYDPFILGLSVPFKDVPYFVASDDILSKKFIGKLVTHLCRPIPKTKSVSDTSCVRTMIKVIKEGRKVMVFPEGNRTYSGELCVIDKSIAKLAKMVKCPLIIFNMVGGYGAEPRWKKDFRKGHIDCVLKKVYSADEVKEMDLDSLYSSIIENLSVNEIPSIYKYESDSSAEYLERCLYYCPNCGSFETLRSEGSDLKCTKCGYTLRYNEDLTFTLIKGEKEFLKVADLYNHQREVLKNLSIDDMNNLEFKDEHVRLFKVEKMKGRRTIIKDGECVINKNGITITNKKKSVTLAMEVINNACILGKNKANFFIGSTIYQLKGEPRFSGAKYVEYYFHYRNLLNNVPKEEEFLGI